MRSAEGKPSRAGEVPLQANKLVELIPKLSSKLSYGVVTEENEVKREKRDKAGGKVLWGCIGKVGICIRLFIKPIYCLEI